MYLIAVLGNLHIIQTKISDSHLHMPMYFFLTKLSILDIYFNSPKDAGEHPDTDQSITYAVCITRIHCLDYLQGWTTFSWL
jgi:olfactory receptor